MAKSVWADINNITKEGKLQSLLYKLRNEYMELKRKFIRGELKDTASLRLARKNIARVLTKINQIKRNNA